jgi:DNA-binding CsgD family transcriptional regulator
VVAAVRAEAAWLEGRHDAVLAETADAFESSRRLNAPWGFGRLAVWRLRAGADDLVDGAPEPYSLTLRGEWAAAATRWRERGSPYEAALALADADDDDALREALSTMLETGAAPAAAIVSRKLRSRGARGVPRGQRATTRENPANLTRREAEILGLLTEGLRNAEIAKRLFLSPKTVAHHVSAILGKLGVQTRGEAAAAAGRLGLAPEGPGTGGKPVAQ